MLCWLSFAPVSYTHLATLKNKPLGVAAGLIGLIACHLLGTLQFSLLTGMNFPESALLVSVPYLPKDILSLILAYALGLQIRTVSYTHL